MKKIIPLFAVIVLAVGAGSFYGGMKYGQSQPVAAGTRGDFADFRNLSPEERQQRTVQMGMRPGSNGGFNGSRGGQGFVNGEIIAADDQSITVKLRDGGSKIVFISSSTEISKFVAGEAGDLAVGENVTVMGQTNTDGSVTAQTIQMRPPVPVPSGDRPDAPPVQAE